MIIDVLKQFSSIIRNYQIDKFRTFESAHEIIGKIVFIDNSELIFRDYLFSDSIRKYSFHWQRDSECVVRWDNAPHHQEVVTFPHHKHSGNVEQISDSEPMTLKKTLTFIPYNLKND